MRRRQPPKRLKTRDAFEELKLDLLRPLVGLLRPGFKGRKDEILDELTGTLTSPKRVRSLYDELDEYDQKAIQEATHDPEGALHGERYLAKYGRRANLGSGSYRSWLSLFFPDCSSLPLDLHEILRAFVPRPEALSVSTVAELPASVGPVWGEGGRKRRSEEEDSFELRVRQTAQAAQLELKAVLRLVDAGSVRVGEKTGRPGKATLKAVDAVLTDGDYYRGEDSTDDWEDRSADAPIKAFAWPLLLQAAGLASQSGSKLELSASGRKATAEPAHAVLRRVWEKWLKTTLLDEFNRVESVKGQQSRGALTAAAPRRQVVADALRNCPAGEWFAVEEFFRVLQASDQALSVMNDPWKLYFGELYYGNLGTTEPDWEVIEGRFALAFLFEYAATLGLVDVAYVPPEGARPDYGDLWGTDDLGYVSRYDGLRFVRINALGAWILGQAEKYVPEAVPAARVLRVLPNRDVVAADQPLTAGDVLLLERFATRKSEAVWHLEADTILEAVERGLRVEELQEFLLARSQEALPHTVEVFLSDLAGKAGRLEDLGAARLIACADAQLAQLLANDRRLRGLCRLAGDSQLVFRALDEAAVRRALRELGYVLPPTR